MIRYLFRVFYLGCLYSGFQRQPSGQGIENFIEIAFIKTGLIHSFKKNNYRACSRTDAGVNALSNVFSLKLAKTPKLEHLNDNLPNNRSIIIWDYAEVPDNFDPRKANFKQYSYYLSDIQIPKLNFEKIFDFIGTHDFSGLIKKHGAGVESSINTIRQIDLSYTNSGVWITLKGNKFGREQIRQIVGYLLDKRYLHMSTNDCLTKYDIYPLNIESADPKYLILTDIHFEGKINWKRKHRNLKYLIQEKLITIYNQLELTKVRYFHINRLHEL
jgi:tRNA pseudouridine38-40 synthase